MIRGIISPDIETGPSGATRYGDVEGDRSDLDHIFILENRTGDLDTIDACENLVIQAFQNPFRALIGDPAMRAGDLWERDAKVAGLTSPDDHFIR